MRKAVKAKHEETHAQFMARRKREEAAYKKAVKPFEDLATFRALIHSATIPSNFSFEDRKQDYGFGPHAKTYHSVAVVSEKAEVEIEFTQDGSGHVRFKYADGKSYTFDRLGVEDSFYWMPHGSFDMDECPMTKESITAIVDFQLARIEDARKRHVTAISIPGIPFTVQPEDVEDLKKRLRDCGHLSFTPAGFGTGYTVSTRSDFRARQYNSEKDAPKALCAFLGHKGPLYITTFDAD